MDIMMRRLGYIGEDKRATSDKELRGWYSYGLAAEVFAVCGVASFLPVTLEQLARERGVLKIDGVTPCSGAAAAVSHRSLWPARREEDNQCVIHLLGSDINTASFAMYTFSIAVFVQTLTLVSISAIADYGDHRKRLLVTAGFVGSASCALFLVVTPQIYLVGPILVIISIACLGSSFVLLNSFLPLLVSNHSSIVNSPVDSGPVSACTTPRLEINTPFQSRDDFTDVELRGIGDESAAGEGKQLQLSHRISAKGVGLGYAASVLVQVFSIGILLVFARFHFTSSKTLPMRVVLLLVGMWWAAFTIPTALWLRPRPGPPIQSVGLGKTGAFRWVSYISFAWLSLWDTIRMATRLRQVTIFLAGWFLLSDALATVSGTAILFARTELQMDTVQVAALSITATLSGIVGAICWPRIAKAFNLKTNQTIMACIALFEIIPLYGLLGFIPIVKSWGVGGLQKPWEIFPLGFIHGFVMGGLSSLCRSFYGVLIPPGSEAAFFALYAVTDKGSSVIGPAIVGRIVDTTGSIRPAFWFLTVLVIAPIFFIRCVDLDKGRSDALAMADGMEKSALYQRINPESTDD